LLAQTTAKLPAAEQNKLRENQAVRFTAVDLEILDGTKAILSPMMA